MAFGRPVLVQKCGNPIEEVRPPIATDVPDKTPLTPSLMTGVEPELEWEPQPFTPMAQVAPEVPDTLLPSGPFVAPVVPSSGMPVAAPLAFWGPVGGGGSGGFGWLPLLGVLPFVIGSGGGNGGGGGEGVSEPQPIGGVVAVPEASTLWMMCSGGGLAAAALLARRRRAS